MLHPERVNTPLLGPNRKETHALLENWLDIHGIQAVLFDLDDTLLDTFGLINAFRDAYISYLHGLIPTIAKEDLKNAVNDSETEIFTTHSVSPNRWHGIAELLSRKYPHVQASIFTQGALDMLSIYSFAPQPFPSTREVLNSFQTTGRKLGVVTHANREWTALKLRETGLSTYFDHIEVVDEFGHKSSDDWLRACDALGVDPEKVVVIGDSVQGDIKAARDAGVRYLVLLPSPVPYYAEGEIPDGVIRAQSIDGVISALVSTA